MDQQQMENTIKKLQERLDYLEKSDRYIFQKHIQMLEGRNMQTGVSTGTKFGLTGNKIGFLGATPVIQQSAITAPSGGGTIDSQARTAIGTIITYLQTFGFTA